MTGRKGRKLQKTEKAENRGTSRTGANPSAFSAFLPFLLSCFIALLPACSSPQTTRLTVDDLDDAAAAMAESLLRSDALARRGPESEPWVVSIQDITNLSGDVIPRREQWALISMLQASLPIRNLWEQANIRFVLPAERVREQRRSGNLSELGSFGSRRDPTHVMTGTIRSLERAQTQTRSDLYYVQFEILDLSTGRPVWQDAFEFKRQAFGEVRD